jgi:hypothetical protein
LYFSLSFLGHGFDFVSGILALGLFGLTFGLFGLAVSLFGLIFMLSILVFSFSNGG